MSPAVQLCAGAGGILQEGERQGNSIKPFWARGEATRSLRLNGNGSNTQLILNCQRRRRSKLMHFLDNWKQMLFPKMETSKSTFNIVPCCNGVVSLGVLRHVGLFALALNDPQLMCFSIWGLFCLFFFCCRCQLLLLSVSSPNISHSACLPLNSAGTKGYRQNEKINLLEEYSYISFDSKAIELDEVWFVLFIFYLSSLPPTSPKHVPPPPHTHIEEHSTIFAIPTFRPNPPGFPP